ncbi:MAG: hypothetical protein JWN38_1002 [Candidatus Saccharibacteria bacterium]|nr:hypothetical protein [Candidatus Saccharibacteria bacterium]
MAIKEQLDHAAIAASHLPNAVGDVLTNNHGVGSAIIAAGVGTTALAMRRFRKHSEVSGYDARYATSTASKTPELKPVIGNRKQRMLPVALGVTGAAIGLAAHVTKPDYEVTVANPNAAVVVVDDVSSSMRYTGDIGGMSRDAAVEQGIYSANYAGSLGVVAAGANSVVLSSPTRQWQPNRAALQAAVDDAHNDSPTYISPVGDSLSQAIHDASDILPKNPLTHQGEGTLLIVSDGTLQASTSEVGKEAAELKAAGIKTEVLVVGSSNKNITYTTPDTNDPQSSYVKPETFSAFSNVTTAASMNDVQHAIHSQIESAGRQEEERDYPYIEEAGFALAALGAAAAFVQIANRRDAEFN